MPDHDEELIARLRMGVPTTWEKQAADRIDELITIRDTLRRLLAKQTARAERLEAERDALIVVLADCPIPQVAEEARTTIARLKGADHE